MSRFHDLRVAEVRRETDDCVSVRLELPPELVPLFSHTHGQHLIVKASVGGEEVRRTYSICAGIDEGELRIAVKKQPDGRFSTYVNEQLRVGDQLSVMPPAGRFFTPLHAETSRLYVAFAAGSGITPVFSIVKTLLAREPRSRFILVYGNRTTGSIIFREELEDLKNRYMTRFALYHVLSGEPQDIELFSGRIDQEKVRKLCALAIPPHEVDAWFICGPAPMIGDVSSTLETLGVDKKRIHFEFFTSEGNKPRQRLRQAPAVESKGDRSRITVIIDGKRVEFELPFHDLPILDAALAAGADLPFACKGGVCCTCRCRLIEGKVAMEVNYALEDWELERGYILACQSRPLTERIVIDYDQA